jgi:hypothetical protein
MTTFKMPEPSFRMISHEPDSGVYTIPDMQAALRDVLEQAATYADQMGMITAPEIRAMIKEIPE